MSGRVRGFLLALLALSACAPGALLAQTDARDPLVPRFVEETGAAGLDSVYEGEWEYMVGGGVAVFDRDADLMPDMVLAGGSAPARLYRNTGTPEGALRFAQAPSGLEIAGVTGAYPLDVDSDGVIDLALLRVGENVLMRGQGDCRFAPANAQWDFAGGDGWSTAFAATWEAGNAFLTLAVGNYIDRTEDLFPWGSCTENQLYRPAPEGPGFAAPLALAPSHCALSMLFTNWNRSGTPALRVSNDREYYRGGSEQLWHLAPGEAPRLFTENDGRVRLKIWGMGIASADLDSNGYPDYFLTSMTDNHLQVLAPIAPGAAPVPRYIDEAYARGVTAHRPYVGEEIRPSTAWHAQFEDVNNDRLFDLFIAKGNVWAMPDFAMEDPNNLLLGRADGRFVEAGDRAGVASMLTARGGALADFNLDGLLDLVVVNRHGPAQFWRNVTENAGGFVALRPHQTGPNPDAVGAWIEVRVGEAVTRREITVGGGHASGQAGFVHFGLGDAQGADARVLWPDGAAGPWQPVRAGGFYTLARSGAEPARAPGLGQAPGD